MIFLFSFVLFVFFLWRGELSVGKVYGPQIRALLGIASHICEGSDSSLTKLSLSHSLKLQPRTKEYTMSILTFHTRKTLNAKHRCFPPESHEIAAALHLLGYHSAEYANGSQAASYLTHSEVSLGCVVRWRNGERERGRVGGEDRVGTREALPSLHLYFSLSVAPPLSLSPQRRPRASILRSTPMAPRLLRSSPAPRSLPLSLGLSTES